MKCECNSEQLVYATFDKLFSELEGAVSPKKNIVSDTNELFVKYNDLKKYVTALEQENMRLKEELSEGAGICPEPVKYTLTKVIEIIQMLLVKL